MIYINSCFWIILYSKKAIPGYIRNFDYHFPIIIEIDTEIFIWRNSNINT